MWSDGYHHELVQICPTPGYGNDGIGHEAKLSNLSIAEKKKYKYPSYQSIQFKCFQKPSETQLNLLHVWANKFAQYTRESKNSRPGLFNKFLPINIVGMRLVVEKTEVLEIPIEFQTVEFENVK